MDGKPLIGRVVLHQRSFSGAPAGRYRNALGQLAAAPAIGEIEHQANGIQTTAAPKCRRQTVHEPAAKEYAQGHTSQNIGVRKGRGIFGSVNRSTNTPAQTMTKASSSDGHQFPEQANREQARSSIAREP